MVADMTAAGVGALENVAEESMHVMRKLLSQVGAVGVIAESRWIPSEFDLRLAGPGGGRQQDKTAALSAAAGVFTTLVQILAGSAAVVAVLSGPGIVAASVALAAGAGWWRLRGDGEQQRRSGLGDWVDGSILQARQAFAQEMRTRIRAVDRYIQDILPYLFATETAGTGRPPCRTRRTGRGKRTQPATVAGLSD